MSFIYLKFQIVESDKIEGQSMTAAASMSYSPYINPQAVTMFNMSSLLNQKDSRWLQLEVCREYQRQKCTRSGNHNTIDNLNNDQWISAMLGGQGIQARYR